MKNRYETFITILWLSAMAVAFYFNSVRVVVAVFVVAMVIECIREAFYPESYCRKD